MEPEGRKESMAVREITELKKKWRKLRERGEKTREQNFIHQFYTARQINKTKIVVRVS